MIDHAPAATRIRYLAELVAEDPYAPCAGLAAALMVEELAELHRHAGVARLGA